MKILRLRVLPALLAVLLASILWGLHSTAAQGAEERNSRVAGAVDGIIVKWRTGQTPDALKARVAAAAGVARKRGIALRYERGGGLDTHVLKLDKARPLADVEALAREIAANDPSMEYAEADRIMQPMSPPGGLVQ